MHVGCSMQCLQQVMVAYYSLMLITSGTLQESIAQPHQLVRNMQVPNDLSPYVIRQLVPWRASMN